MLWTGELKFLMALEVFKQVALIFCMVFSTGWLNKMNGLLIKVFNNCCLDSSQLSIFPHFFILLCLKFSQKSPFNQNKLQQFVLRSSLLSNQASVSKHMFDQNMAGCLHISWHLMFVSDLPLVVESLLKCDNNNIVRPVFVILAIWDWISVPLSFRFICYLIDSSFCCHFLIFKLEQK